jgi:hypothetical protein
MRQKFTPVKSVAGSCALGAAGDFYHILAAITSMSRGDQKKKSRGKAALKVKQGEIRPFAKRRNCLSPAEPDTHIFCVND